MYIHTSSLYNQCSLTIKISHSKSLRKIFITFNLFLIDCVFKSEILRGGCEYTMVVDGSMVPWCFPKEFPHQGGGVAVLILHYVEARSRWKLLRHCCPFAHLVKVQTLSRDALPCSFREALIVFISLFTKDHSARSYLLGMFTITTLVCEVLFKVAVITSNASFASILATSFAHIKAPKHHFPSDLLL